MASICPNAELPPDASKDDLIKSINDLVDVYRPHKHLLAAASEAGSNRPGIAQLYANLMDRTIDIMTSRIGARRHDSEDIVDTSSKWTATMLTWGTEYGLNNFFSKASKNETQRLIIALADILWNLFYVKPMVLNDKAK